MKILIQFEKVPLLFQNPEFIISCSSPCSFVTCFKDIEDALKRGYYIAGFFSYEAGYCFEEKLLENKAYDFPLIHLGAYKAPVSYNGTSNPRFFQGPVKNRGALHPKDEGFLSSEKQFAFIPRDKVRDFLRGIKLNISQKDYFNNIEIIRDYIAQGEVYQITYCIKLLFEYSGDPVSLYNLLLKEQPVPYPAYIETDRFHILSCSPEMFIKKEFGNTVTKPMKGTWRRGNNIISDIAARLRFQYDSKNRAENVMIADLLRNDLGRVGSAIKAPRLFEVAKYNTLFQMTSTVTGRLDTGISIYELFASLFPSGSVTGAPKIRAMQIIKKLEREERKIYTGAIGYITPERNLFFNIPIRTLLIKEGIGEMGIGGGIVWDSTPNGEWDEGMLKAKFVTDLS